MNPRICPRCSRGRTLAPKAVAELTLAGCAECGGVFVDRETLEGVLAEKALQQELSAVLSAGVPPASAAEVRYLRCPVCKEIMSRRNFGRRSGVIVDACGAHGTWFDADELRRAVAYAAGGGIERARAQEAKEREERRTKRGAEGSDIVMPRGSRFRWGDSDDSDDLADLTDLGDYVISLLFPSGSSR